ncbi:hypothetical protein L5515_008845 [Caenorhabditis briggsae]|uniref:J domain-containing protein n=1 Tax=Caenorhabditis briggsae TaxID=6238 RepID=A0AAE9JMZ0_CAEBR|nr:hypothetical protein L5515_008845 [Caenorhabditis briggsae]
MRQDDDAESMTPEDENEGNLKMAVGATNTRKIMVYSRKVFSVVSCIFLAYALGNMTLFITPGVREILPIFMSQLISRRLFASYITRKNYYEIIGVPATATKEQIRDAFLAKTKKLHPDQSQKSIKDSRVGWATGFSDTEQFMLVKEAYDTLRNEEKRKEYDLAYSREGGFLMEATHKTQQMSTQRRNIQRAEWSADVIPDAKKKAGKTVYSHFRNPEEEYLKEKQKNRMLVVLAAVVIGLIAANVLYIRRLQSRRLLENADSGS